jgi:CRP-like cAMP-binding protein
MASRPALALDYARLRDAALFQGLPDSALEAICRLAGRREIRAGEFFFFQGDPAERIFILLSGRVKLIQSSPDGQQVLLRIAGPYMLFGGVALAQGETYPASAQAGEAGQALSWRKLDLMPLIDQYPRLAVNAMQLMAGHVQEFQERYRQLATERVERRLARSLLRLAAQLGRKVPEGVLIDMPLSRQDLAEMNGTTLYTVSRILSQWEAQGLVITGREKVVIHYPHGLVRIAEDLPEEPTGGRRSS